MTEVERATIQRLMDENAALRREVWSVKYDLTVARNQLANIAVEPGLYVIDVTGEYSQFERQILAEDYSRQLAKDGITSVVVNILSREQGSEEDVEGGTYTSPPRPSHNPQDVRHAA